MSATTRWYHQRPAMASLATVLLLFLFGLCPLVTAAFLPPTTYTNRRRTSSSSSSHLFGINEWRDIMFDLPGTDRTTGAGEAPPRSICILPFPYPEVLLQGETKQLRLYEDRFIQLFKDVQENHAGVVGMGLMAESGIIETMPLCEVEASNTMEGFGIFVTIRVVGRASLLEITKQEPYMRAVCIEVADTLPPNLELPNLLANNIETHMMQISSMEQRVEEAAKLQQKGTNDTTAGGALIQDDDVDEEMAARIARAKLEDRFYEEDEDDVDTEDDNDDEDDDDDTHLDRQGRFRQAYELALSTDTQGYSVSGSTSTGGTKDRTPQELTATSWAAFCSEINVEEDATYRIQALDTDQLFERLKLAAYMLREKKASLEKKMAIEGIKFKDEDEPMS